MKEKKFLCPSRIVFSVLSLAVMALIFMFSCENADKSADTSGGITEFVAEHIVSNFDTRPLSEQQDILSVIDHIVRKSAHFSVFAALGACVSFAAGRRRFFSVTTLGVIGFCFLYACSDELHQYFVPGRSCEFGDVLIDSSGAVTGMFFSFIVMGIMSVISKKEKK